MKRMMAGWLAALVTLTSAESLLAHHSLASFDTTNAVRVKGTIVQFHQINPHSIIFLDEHATDGQTRRWAIEGPSIQLLNRKGVAKDVLKAGDVVEVCGYLPKERVIWQMPSADNAGSTAGRLINAEVL